jgi:hypothetical protein
MHDLKWHHEPKNAFWVAATEEEARKYFVDKLPERELEEFEKACQDRDYLDGWYRGHRDCVVNIKKGDDDSINMIVSKQSMFDGGPPPPEDDSFRFLVTDDLSRVDLGFAVYPYSGMWNGRSPFKKFEREISSPEELKDL